MVELRSQNMVKRIISKGLGLGEARIFTIGLGVMLAVILGLAAATASPTPAVAQGGVVSAMGVWNRVESGGPTASHGKVWDPSSAGQPYRVPVQTFWDLQNQENCTSPPHQKLERQDGNGQWQLVWAGSGPAPYIRQLLETDKSYRYRHTVSCMKAQGPESSVTNGVRFSMHVIEDDKPPPKGITYNGQWVVSRFGLFSGNSTHVAKQVEASATITYDGIAAAWVTTLDAEDTVRARVACERVLCASLDTSYPTREYRRVAWSDSWNTNYRSTNKGHRVQVIADDPYGHVDVDAFIIHQE
jgi:hypothetical protein